MLSETFKSANIRKSVNKGLINDDTLSKSQKVVSTCSFERIYLGSLDPIFIFVSDRKI